MKYKVEHYHYPEHVKTAEPDRKPDKDEYIIDAASPKEAAVLAQGYHEGYTGEEVAPIPFWRSGNPTYPSRTISERIEDCFTTGGLSPAIRQDGGIVFHLNNLLFQWLIVYPLQHEEGKT